MLQSVSVQILVNHSFVFSQRKLSLWPSQFSFSQRYLDNLINAFIWRHLYPILLRNRRAQESSSDEMPPFIPLDKRLSGSQTNQSIRHEILPRSIIWRSRLNVPATRRIYTQYGHLGVLKPLDDSREWFSHFA